MRNGITGVYSMSLLDREEIEEEKLYEKLEKLKPSPLYMDLLIELSDVYFFT